MLPSLAGLCILLFAGCSQGKKSASVHPSFNVESAELTIHREYPGVSGPTWYFLMYELKLSVEAEKPVKFVEFLADGRSLPVLQVVGGQHWYQRSTTALFSGTEKELYIRSQETINLPESSDTPAPPDVPEMILLIYEVNNKRFELPISTVKVGEQVFRPMMHSPHSD